MRNRRTSSREPRTVLVVEDNPDDTLLLQTAAAQACPDVAFHCVPDGFQALAYLKGEGAFANRQTHPLPAVLLLDLFLPGMSGFQMLEQVRRLSHCDGLCVLAWSDGSDPSLAARASQAGVDLFIPKPLSFHHLLLEVRRVGNLARRSTE